MRILIFTQKVDTNDSVLGFFHTWIAKLAREFESVEVICIEKGVFDLPNNVTVHAIGKGYGFGRLKYIFGVYRYLFLIRGTYDKVFIHMNQEYVFSLGLYWRLMGIPVYLWRNHPRGSWLTRIAVLLSTKVFCTSKDSFTAQFKKTIIMPAGIDTDTFKLSEGIVRKKYSLCMVGRISPIKHNELALKALHILVQEGSQVSLEFIGGVAEKDAEYFKSLQNYVIENSLSQSVHFADAVTLDKLPVIYSGFEICLNLTEAGSFDKTIVESSACGAIPLVTNPSFNAMLPAVCVTPPTPKDIAEAVKVLLNPQTLLQIQKNLAFFVESQSLSHLIQKLVIELK